MAAMQDSHFNPTDRDINIVAPPKPHRQPGKWLIPSLIVLVIGISSVLLITNHNRQNAQAEPVATVQITASGFMPQTIKIKQGQSLTWVNADTSLHQIAADPYPSHSKLPSLVSDDSLAENETYNFTFDKTGTYTYHDPLNPTVLKGTVIVE
jgi:plastocyanin